MGLNIEGKAVFSSKTQLQAGVTLQRSRYKEPEKLSENRDVAQEKKIFRTPDLYGYFTAVYNPIKPLSIALTGTITGPMLVQHFEGSGKQIDMVESTLTYSDITSNATYYIKLFNYATLQLNAGILNIFNAFQKVFDQGPERDSGHFYVPIIQL